MPNNSAKSLNYILEMGNTGKQCTKLCDKREGLRCSSVTYTISSFAKSCSFSRTCCPLSRTFGLPSRTFCPLSRTYCHISRTCCPHMSVVDIVIMDYTVSIKLFIRHQGTVAYLSVDKTSST